MTCEAKLGVCQLCYGMDLATGAMVEEGMAVGIIAAQSIGEPGTQLTMRTFHIGGTVNTSIEEHETRAKQGGEVRFVRVQSVRTQEGKHTVLARNAEIALLDEKGRELEKHEVPMGAELMVDERQQVKSGEILCQWDPHSIPILAEVDGIVRFMDIEESSREEKDGSGHVRRVIVEHKADQHPQIIIEDKEGNSLDVYYLPERAFLEVKEGAEINAGSNLAKTPREASGVSDITGGLPRVTEIFEARKPKDPAVIAEIDGVVEIEKETRRGKRTIIVRNAETGREEIHLVPHGKRFLVHAGDFVRAGQALVDGSLLPHDILRVSGEEAVQRYLLHEIQQVYRSQRVEINDKHIEIIVARMLRKVLLTDAGDSKLLPGIVIDRGEFRKANDAMMACVKISDPGDASYEEGAIVPKDQFVESNAEIEVLGGKVAKHKKPKLAQAATQLLGITKASVQSESFISAASFQETTKVLTEAALASKEDPLVGLKENVILGHLIPAGTGFRTLRDSEIRFLPEALQEVSRDPDESVVSSFPLLQGTEAQSTPEPTPAESVPTLDELFGPSSEDVSPSES